MEEAEFSLKLKEALNLKQEWLKSECLEEMLSQYRLLHTCIKNIYELLVKRSAILEDPYRLDKKIVSISIPDTTPFPEQERSTIFGTRFSDYEVMLDFICTYFRFSLENLTLPNIKKLIDFNNFFDWDDLSTGNNKVNTKAFATVIENVRANCEPVIQSMLLDSLNKCKSTTAELNRELSDVAVYKKELYKCELRTDLFNHPDFKKEKAKESAEAELMEIKRLYTKVLGKKPFYGDLVGEIIKEDTAPDKEKRQEAVLNYLQIKATKKAVVKKKVIEPKEVLMDAVISLGVVAPILDKLRGKLIENFDLLFTKKLSFFGKLIKSLKKSFGVREKEKVINVPIKDGGTGTDRTQKLKVSEFLYDLGKKCHIYNGIGTKGVEYKKIESSPEESILQFLSKQISELQSVFNIINSLDSYFKSDVDTSLRPRIRGMKMELSTFRNSIIKANKKRGEYVAFKEEAAQMKKLGIVDDEE